MKIVKCLSTRLYFFEMYEKIWDIFVQQNTHYNDLYMRSDEGSDVGEDNVGR